MGKTHGDHRVIVRDEHGQIIYDFPYPHHAAARPAYDNLAKLIAEGQSITLQHGARIISKVERDEPPT